MSSLNPYGHIKPTSDRFSEYLDELVTKWRAEGIRPQKIHGALSFLRVVEKLRLGFSSLTDNAFATKKISNRALADLLGYKTIRQVQKIRAWLEEQGVLRARRFKLNAFWNGWNSFELCAFKDWFIKRYQQAACKTGHPKEENNLRLLFEAKCKSRICFPQDQISKSYSKHRLWRVLALEEVSYEAELPDLAQLSDKFRVNLRKLSVHLDHPNIIGLWKSFVRKAVIFQKMRVS